MRAPVGAAGRVPADLAVQLTPCHLLQLPEEYVEEMRGLEDGFAAGGHADAARFAKFGITLANAATGDVEHDIEYIIVNQVR